MADSNVGSPGWQQSLEGDPELARQVEEAKRDHLLLDPRPLPQMADMVLKPMSRFTILFWLGFLVLGGGVLVLGITWLYQMYWGIGITGLSRPTMWAVYIANFVFFVGIGHAGTFISAALRAMHFEWRAPISRAAETLTVFALMTAALFPLIHLGRTWKGYWLLPYPNERQLWPDYHSPLLWDVTAILTYLTCSILFEWIGLLPDLALARDRNPSGWRHRLYEMLSLGWRGTERQWATTKTAADIFTYAIIPVMFSVHTIVSWDFAMALQPGWHSTVFGPYFIIGALFSGIGAVILVLAVVRKAMHLEYFIRAEHFDGMGKFLLVLSFAWAYFYFNDFLAPWFGQEPVHKTIDNLLIDKWASPFWYLMMFGNIILPWTLLGFKRLRTSVPVLAFVSVFVLIGMWIERYLIVGVMLGQNWLPYSWGKYTLRLPETLITVGAFCFVGFALFVFTRFFPIIPVWEIHEGQVLYGLKRIGRVILRTRTEPE